MSRFLSPKYADLTPYTPGEQPPAGRYIKLNTNESPFAPPADVLARAAELTRPGNLYCDVTCAELREALAAVTGAAPGQLLVTNGSDEILSYAFMAFCDDRAPALFPDVTYGFYSVFAAIHRVPWEEIPLREDFSICVDDYIGRPGTVFLANPNAPTGLLLPRGEIERLLRADPDRVVVVDEAYIDFGGGGESCLPLIGQYPNLLVTRTFSKSRSMAGVRLGFGAACEDLIADLNAMKFSLNPYNVSSPDQALGRAMLEREDLTAANCAEIVRNRTLAAGALREMGFFVTESWANFLFVRTDAMSGEGIFDALKERGILVRHFSGPRISDYNRITIGTRQQTEALIAALRDILSQEG